MQRIKESNLVIRRAEADDIPGAAKVHELAFPRQTFLKIGSIVYLDHFQRANYLLRSVAVKS